MYTGANNFNSGEHFQEYKKWFPHLRHRHTEDLLVAASGGVDAGDGLSVDVPQV